MHLFKFCIHHTLGYSEGPTRECVHINFPLLGTMIVFLLVLDCQDGASLHVIHHVGTSSSMSTSTAFNSELNKRGPYAMQ